MAEIRRGVPATPDTRLLTLDELVNQSAAYKALISEYAAYGLDTPDWVSRNLRLVSKEIESKKLDVLERRLASAKARAAALTPEEKKLEAVQAEIAELEAALNPK